MKYKIDNITDAEGNTRIDGRYPIRIGSVIQISRLLKGSSAIFSYLERDNKPYEGTLVTSIVEEMCEIGGYLIISTMNSIYYLTEYKGE